MGIAGAYEVAPESVPLRNQGPVAQLVVAVGDQVDKPWVARGSALRLGSEAWRVTAVSTGVEDRDRTVVLQLEGTS